MSNPGLSVDARERVTEAKLREFVEEKVRLEIERKVGKDLAVPAEVRRTIIEDALRTGTEEVDYTVRRLVRRAARASRRRAKKTARRPDEIQRFSMVIRVQHGILAASVLLLIITGAPIKFHNTGWVGSPIQTLHLIDALKITHRIAAAAMAFASVWHILWIVFTRSGWMNFVNFLPRLDDIKHLWQMLKHLTGRAEERPYFGRFSFTEKFDYWAVYWGVIIMLGTGCLLVFNTYFMNMLGPYSMHIAKLIHSDEALLASLALLIWHFYWAHFNPAKFPMNKVIFTGNMSISEMIHEHPAELEQRIRSGEISRKRLAEYPDWLAMHPESGRETEVPSK